MAYATTNGFIMFEVYAIDNCDATSTCTNLETGTGNTQTNNCTDFSTCQNEAIGDENAQTNNCDSSPGGEFLFGCLNSAIGDRNNQRSACANVGGFGVLMQRAVKGTLKSDMIDNK